MAVRLPNPYYARSPGGLPSGGGSIVPPAPVDPNVGVVGGLASMFSNLLGYATYDEERDPRAQAARKYRLEGDALEAQAAGRSTLGSLFGSLDMSPEGIRSGVQRMSEAAARAGIKPEQIADLFRFAVANTPGTTNDQVTRAVVGAGGSALGADQSYTTAGQESIRRDNERMAKDELRTKETGLDRRNTADNERSRLNNEATIAGMIDRAEMEERGRDIRRFDAPVNAAPGTRTYFAPGDPRNTTGTAAPTTAPRQLTLAELAGAAAQGGDDERAAKLASMGRAGQAPTDVSPNDVAGLAEMIDAALEGAGVNLDDMDKGLRLRVRDRASTLYQTTRNAQQSVSQSISELLDVTDDRNGWQRNMPNFLGGADVEAKPRTAPPGVANPPPANEVAVGTTATGPGGKKVRWDGAQWVPVN